MTTRAFARLAFLALLPVGARADGGATAVSSSASAPPAVPPGPIRMEPLSQATPPTFAMRGQPVGPGRLVFLHGMCAHALGYAQAFQFSAAKRGTLIAPQGDKPCQGPWASWTGDLDALDARIVTSFRRLGHADPIDDIVVIGYSQGAVRAEELARRWPERYTRLVLIGSPRVSSPRGFDLVRSTVMMAGDHDRLDLMRRSAKVLAEAGIPSTFMILPEANHGAMGAVPERTMGDALEWLFAHDKSRPESNSDR